MNICTKVRSHSGSAFVELVVLLPLLIFLVGGVFELGRMYYIQNTLEYGAKEAARIGASIKESVDANFMSRGTVNKSELESLILNSVRVNGVIEEPGQFTIRYLNMAGNTVQGVQDLPFDRQNNPGAIDFVEVTITYPGSGPRVNRPIPLVFNVPEIFPASVVLMSKAIFQVEGRFER